MMKKYGFLCILLILGLADLYGQPAITINEVMYDPDGTDSGWEWIELFNADSCVVHLSSWQIEKAGTAFTVCFTFPESTRIHPRTFLLIGENQVDSTDFVTSLGFQNGGSETDGIRLVDSLHQVVDCLFYDEPNTNLLEDESGFPATSFAPDVASGHSLARNQDGYDTNQSATDFFECSNPSPGQSNQFPINFSLTAFSVLEPNVAENTLQQCQGMIRKNFPGTATCELIIEDNGTPTSTFSLLMTKDSLFWEQALNLSPGFHYLQSRIISVDMDSTDNVLATGCLAGTSPLLINEILYRPNNSDGEPEWIELINTSSQPLDLAHLSFADNHHIFHPIPEFSIKANDYAILTDDSIAFQETYSCTGNIFEPIQWEYLNNDDDQIILHYFDACVDSVAYQGNCNVGQSWERILPHENLWQACPAMQGSTPLAYNASSPPLHQITIDSLGFQQQALIAYLRNSGLLSTAAQLFFFQDTNANWQWEDTDLLCDQQTIELIPNQQMSFRWNMVSDSAGVWGVTVDWGTDADTAFCTFLPYPGTPLIWNEIFYNAPGLDDGAEWIELYARQFIPNLQRWTFSINQIPIDLPQQSINAGEFLMITQSDSASFEHSVQADFSLPNSEATLLLQHDSYKDSLTYFSDWGGNGNGQSLERIYFDRMATENWGESMTPTPGMRNSITPPDIDLAIHTVQPWNQGNSFQFNVFIKNLGLQNTSGTLCFWHDINVDQQMQTDEFLQTLDITIDSNHEKQISIEHELSATGYYGFTLQASSDAISSNNEKILFCELPHLPSLQINEIYYANQEDEPEWIEIYNVSDQTIRLDSLLFFVDENSAFLYGTSLLNPQSYALLLPDSELGQIFAQTHSVPYLLGLPTLPNSEAQLSLLYHDYLQESFGYRADWGGGKGISLERFSPNLPANNPQNWSSSLAASGSTPGIVNSIFLPAFPEEATISLNPNPFSPDHDGREDIQVIQISLPSQILQITIEIFDLRGRKVATIRENETSLASTQIIWTGLDNQQRPLPVGPYFMVIQAIAPERSFSYQKISYIATPLH